MTWSSSLEAELRHLVRREYRNQVKKSVSCEGKPAFDSRAHAENCMPRRTIHGRVALYRCKHCGKWHIGSHLGNSAKDRRPRPEHDAGAYLCPCGHSFPDYLGKYGCPNCCGESGPARAVT